MHILVRTNMIPILRYKNLKMNHRLIKAIRIIIPFRLNIWILKIIRIKWIIKLRTDRTCLINQSKPIKVITDLVRSKMGIAKILKLAKIKVCWECRLFLKAMVVMDQLRHKMHPLSNKTKRPKFWIAVKEVMLNCISRAINPQHGTKNPWINLLTVIKCQMEMCIHRAHLTKQSSNNSNLVWIVVWMCPVLNQMEFRLILSHNTPV